jgi:hypothetical protein
MPTWTQEERESEVGPQAVLNELRAEVLYACARIADESPLGWLPFVVGTRLNLSIAQLSKKKLCCRYPDAQAVNGAVDALVASVRTKLTALTATPPVIKSDLLPLANAADAFDAITASIPV